MSAAPPTTRPIRVAIVNDYELVVRGVRMMLAPWSDRIEIVELVVESAVRKHVDIALVDMFGQDRSAIHKVQPQLRNAGVARVVVYAWQFSTEAAHALIRAGVSGVISKQLPAAKVANALLLVAAGRTVIAPNGWSSSGEELPFPPDASGNQGDWPGRQYGLTMREAEMIAMITQGLTNVEIAQRTFLSGNTVKTYIRGAYRKIGVTRRSQAVAWGLHHGMFPGAKPPL